MLREFLWGCSREISSRSCIDAWGFESTIITFSSLAPIFHSSHVNLCSSLRPRTRQTTVSFLHSFRCCSRTRNSTRGCLATQDIWFPTKYTTLHSFGTAVCIGRKSGILSPVSHQGQKGSLKRIALRLRRLDCHASKVMYMFILARQPPAQFRIRQVRDFDMWSTAIRSWLLAPTSGKKIRIGLGWIDMSYLPG